MRRLSKAAGALAVLSGTSICLIAASTVISSFSRYLLNIQIPVVVEMNGFLLLVLVFTGSAWTQSKGRHISVDLVTTHLSPGWKRWVELLASIMVVAMLVLMVIATFQGAVDSTAKREIVTSVIDLPKWIVMWFIPLGSLGMLLVVLEDLAGKIRDMQPAKQGSVKAG